MTPIDQLRLNLKNSLMASGTKQHQFAATVGISQPAISAFLRGKNRPWKKNLVKIENEMRLRG